MSKRDREKLRKLKARKVRKAKAARAKAKETGDSTAPNPDPGTAFASSPFGVDSVGRSTGGGGGAPRLPRRSKKG
ncbi:MAG: hypothetical protein V3W34_13680 [Phycisphaerae bacterium]